MSWRDEVVAHVLNGGRFALNMPRRMGRTVTDELLEASARLHGAHVHFVKPGEVTCTAESPCDTAAPLKGSAQAWRDAADDARRALGN